MDKTADVDYPIHELIARRWSPRSFEARPIPDADLRGMLEAARWAASSFNEQPWRFIVARRQDRDGFERALGCLTENNRHWARNAGALILTAVSKTFERNGKPNRVALHDLGKAAGYLVLEATARGLHARQMAGVDLERVRETHGVPEGFEPQTAIAIGYAGDPEDESGPRTRKPQSEFVFESHWGQPAAW